MRRKKNYLGIFYGSNRELNEAFVKITSGEYIRYIVTDETLICRFISKLDIHEIDKIFKEHVKTIPFFIFPINTKSWSHNLPFEAENNLLTDNPIIQPTKKQPEPQPASFFLNLLAELRKRQEENQEVEKSFKTWINETTNLSDIVGPDGFLVINGYRIKKEDLIEILKYQMNTAIEDENYELAGNIKKKLQELDKINPTQEKNE